MSHGFKAKYQTLTIERHADLARGNVATIRIDRPEAFNAVNEQMHEDLANVFRAAQYDSADVFVLTGTGGIVEIQGTAEDDPFSEEAFLQLMELAKKGVGELTTFQNMALAD